MKCSYMKYHKYIIDVNKLLLRLNQDCLNSFLDCEL